MIKIQPFRTITMADTQCQISASLNVNTSLASVRPFAHQGETQQYSNVRYSCTYYRSIAVCQWSGYIIRCDTIYFNKTLKTIAENTCNII